MRTIPICLGALLGLAACAGGERTTAPAPARGSAEGFIAYDGFVAARALEGETVSAMAGRLGLPAERLAAYNGLSPSHPLRAGDELVVPPGS